MGCRKLQIKDYFTLLTSQNTPTTDTYAHENHENHLTKIDQQLLIHIQTLLKILCGICELRTNAPIFNTTTYTYGTLQDNFTTTNQNHYTLIHHNNINYIYANFAISATNNYLKTTAIRESYNQNTIISQYDYNNDALGRRISMGKSGTAFTAADTISYGYDDKSQVTSASSANDSTYDFDYNFDQIGNRISATSADPSDPSNVSYTSNSLNQYTAIQEDANPAQSPSYDTDGNMLTLSLESGDWANTYNAENRIIVAESATAKLEMVYDYMGRRVEKKVYSGSTGNWTLDKHSKFVYDGYVQIEELDADNSNAILNKRIWSSGKIICDICKDASTQLFVAYYALGDANKNITEYVDASGTVQGHYEYSPFGKITKSSGAMVDDFDYRFSSEFGDDETGLVYYNYRYYSAELGRWLKRDPIQEAGGYNLYGMVNNNPVNWWDYLGQNQSNDNTKTTKSIDIDTSSQINTNFKDEKSGYEVIVKQCQIVILYGHGSSKRPHTFQFDNKKLSRGIFRGCCEKTTNSKIPEESLLVGRPKPTIEDAKKQFKRQFIKSHQTVESMLKAMLKAWEKEAYGTSGDIDDTIAWAQVKKDAKIAEKIAKEKLCCFDECKASGVNVIFIHAPSSSFFGDLGEFILGKTVNWDQERKLWGGKKWKGNFNVPCNNEK